MSFLFSYSNYNSNFLIIIAFVMILSYEVINGFHDSANAIATIIYTHTLSSELAVIVSGIFNFLGVMFGGLSVAYTIVHLLSIDLLLNINSSYGLKAIFSILFAAMLWNLCTWFFYLPTSSSHTLIGTIIGINITYAISNHFSIIGSFNFSKLLNVFLSLIISPILGLVFSGILVLLFQRFWKISNNNSCYYTTNITQNSYDPCHRNVNPPFLVKTVLILSSIGVSYSHGANDGQKGIGLIMLVLICLFPSEYFVNLNASKCDINQTKSSVLNLEKYYIHNKFSLQKSVDIMSTRATNIKFLSFKRSPDEKMLAIFHYAYNLLQGKLSYTELNIDQRYKLRQSLLYITEFIDIINQDFMIKSTDKHFLNNLKKDLLYTVEYAPIWIIVLVAVSLSIGTVIGWRRIAMTFGEKIGTKNMTYAQAMASQLTSAISIGTASYTGIPVSTTHIVSSSITGTILINGDEVQMRTIKNIIVAWILTFPVSMILSSSLYWISLKFIS
ncbi:MAG: inorganic phosphate transporter [Buchnera aphidicola (Meitanaphis flavogallis)]